MSRANEQIRILAEENSKLRKVCEVQKNALQFIYGYAEALQDTDGLVIAVAAGALTAGDCINDR